jgi:hypothetical protein
MAQKALPVLQAEKVGGGKWPCASLGCGVGRVRAVPARGNGAALNGWRRRLCGGVPLRDSAMI